jgi:subtilase family serine protease
MPHPRTVRGLAALATITMPVLMGATAVTCASATAATSTSWVATATRATSIPDATLSGDAAASAPVALAVALKPQNPSAELAALKAMYQPGSPSFRDFLTPAQWVAAYAPTTAQVDAVTNYLSQNGFTGLSVQSDRLLVTANGTVGQAEQAFNTTIGDYIMPNGGAFQANIGPAEVPAALGGTVQAVVGLSNWCMASASASTPTRAPTGAATTSAPAIPKWPPGRRSRR